MAGLPCPVYAAVAVSPPQLGRAVPVWKGQHKGSVTETQPNALWKPKTGAEGEAGFLLRNSHTTSVCADGKTCFQGLLNLLGWGKRRLTARKQAWVSGLTSWPGCVDKEGVKDAAREKKRLETLKPTRKLSGKLHTWNPITAEAEARGLQAQGQPELQLKLDFEGKTPKNK